MYYRSSSQAHFIHVPEFYKIFIVASCFKIALYSHVPYLWDKGMGDLEFRNFMLTVKPNASAPISDAGSVPLLCSDYNIWPRLGCNSPWWQNVALSECISSTFLSCDSSHACRLLAIHIFNTKYCKPLLYHKVTWAGR